MRRYYNLVLMVLWLGVAFVLLAPEGVVPEKLRQQLGGPLQLPVAILALTLAVYNGVRWWAYRSLVRHSPAVTVNPLAVRRPREEGDDEPNPAFDFSKPAEPEPPPGPSANGDRR